MDAEAAARKRQTGWHAAVSEEESRAYLQERLVVMAKLMFLSFAVLLGFMLVTYKLYRHVLHRDYEPELNHYVFAVSAAGMATLAFLWRGLLLQRQLTLAQLRRIDEFFIVGTGTIFCVSAVLAYDLRASAYICLTYICLNVLLRATIVPSTGRRTAIVGMMSCLPMTVATGVLVYLNKQDVPGPVYVGGGLLISIMAILIATVVSNTLYTYRRQITEAMQLGQYTLDRKIGEGGNGAVYRARHALLRRPTAIKLILPNLVDGDTLDRFEREVQHMSLLTHANTVAVFDYGRNLDGVFYYAMEYLDGIDLENLIRRYGAQPAERVVPILIQVCGALQEAHRRGLIHRDIKPANIIVSERGDVPDVAKVVDFGLVKEIAGDTGKSATRGIMGTPSYISPESVTDPDTITAAADLYSLGAVGYYLITGKRVFDGKTSVDVCVQHVTAPPKPPSQVAPEGTTIPPALEAILLRCLAKAPSARPASAAELARMLRDVPLGDAWSETRATAWWDDFRKAEAAAPTVVDKTRTVTVDIAVRTPVVGQPETP